MRRKISTKPFIVDEICYCDHKRSQHNDTLVGGHGSCSLIGCPCTKFTWRAFIVWTKDGLQQKTVFKS